jgi:hypothetical protein
VHQVVMSVLKNSFCKSIMIETSQTAVHRASSFVQCRHSVLIRTSVEPLTQSKPRVDNIDRRSLGPLDESESIMPFSSLLV